MGRPSKSKSVSIKFHPSANDHASPRDPSRAHIPLLPRRHDRAAALRRRPLRNLRRKLEIPVPTAADVATTTSAAAAAAETNADGVVENKPEAPDSGALRQLSSHPWLAIVATMATSVLCSFVL
ncbi:hypothetical protein NUW58_g2936 [Xylaria curta]|uniref:Uncharacterized protein n=1 Tax=Xylaria curta TaxID=42375 RepID=A0ACC1PFY5_9PEZI|nr:hypothetical protein NUW58_g2936 [Xylaria curta]